MSDNNFTTISLSDYMKRRQKEKAKKEAEREELFEKIVNNPDGSKRTFIAYRVEHYQKDDETFEIPCSKKDAELLDHGLIQYIDIKEFRDWLFENDVLFGKNKDAFEKAGLNDVDTYRRLMDLYREDGNQEALDEIHGNIEKNNGDEMTRLYAESPLPPFGDFIILCTAKQKKLYELGFIELSEMPIYRDVIRRRYDLEEIREKCPDLYASLLKYEEEDKERLEQKRKRQQEEKQEKEELEKEADSSATPKDIADASRRLPEGRVKSNRGVLEKLMEKIFGEMRS